MLVASVPVKFAVPWANSAGGSYLTYPIPTASQIPITPGRASLTDGFPPLTTVPIASGGVPPFAQDMNGGLKMCSASIQWTQAGGPWIWDSTFEGNIGGYPQGATLTKATLVGYWQNTVDGNTTNPDTGGAGWVDPLQVNGAACNNYFTDNGGSGGSTSSPVTYSAVGASQAVTKKRSTNRIIWRAILQIENDASGSANGVLGELALFVSGVQVGFGLTGGVIASTTTNNQGQIVVEVLDDGLTLPQSYTIGCFARSQGGGLLKWLYASLSGVEYFA